MNMKIESKIISNSLNLLVRQKNRLFRCNKLLRKWLGGLE